MSWRSQFSSRSQLRTLGLRLHPRVQDVRYNLILGAWDIAELAPGLSGDSDRQRVSGV